MAAIRDQILKSSCKNIKPGGTRRKTLWQLDPKKRISNGAVFIKKQIFQKPSLFYGNSYSRKRMVDPTLLHN
jgi:hypothetical protein